MNQGVSVGRLQETHIHFVATAIVAVGVGLLVALAPAIGITAILGLGAVILALKYPEAAVVIALFGGRFNRLPGLELEIGIPLYISAPAIVLAVLSLGLHHRKMRLDLPMVFMASTLTAWVAFSKAWSPSQAYASEKLLEYTLYLLPLLILGSWVGGSAVGRRGIVVWTMVIASALSIAALATPGDDARLAALGGGPNVFGRFMAFGLLSAASLALEAPAKLKLGAYLAGPLLLAGLLLSGSRQAVLGLALIAVAFGFPVLVRFLRKSPMRTATVSLLVLVVGLGISTVVIRNAVLGPRLQLLLSSDKGQSVNARVEWLEESLKFAESRRLIGWGVGAFGPIFSGQDIRAYPHNVVAELALEAGAIGLAIFAGMILRTAKLAIPATWNHDVTHLTLLGHLAFAVLVALVSGDMYDNRFMWFFAGLLSAPSLQKGKRY